MQAEAQNKVEIQIRNMFIAESFVSPNIQEEQEPKLTLEQVLAERDQLLEAAQHEIELERQQFEVFRAEQLETIEQLKQLWEEEKQTLQQQAYDEAFSQGFEDGMRKAEAQMADTLANANAVLKQAEVDAQQYIEAQESVILHIGLRSAERILGKLIEEDEQKFVDIVRRGLKEVREMESIKVYVSTQYYPLLSKSRDELAEMFPPDVQFLVFINEEMTDTDCYIETNHGRVVVSVDEQLQQLRQKLYEILESKE